MRDFSQMRIGLACNLVIFAFTQTNYLRYFSIIAAIGIHLTSLYLVSIMYVIFNGNPIKVLKDKYFILLLFIIFFVGQNIEIFHFIDPRVQTYLDWKRDGYGNAVNSFLQVFFVLFLLFANQRLVSNLKFRVMFAKSYLFALATFISFSSVAIFALRLTNIAMSLYPIAFAYALQNTKKGTEKMILVLILTVLLITRSNSNKIISTIGFR